MSRHALTDEQWAVVEPLLPKQQPGPGRRRADSRRTRGGIVPVLKPGGAWEAMPRHDGSPTTGWRRLQAWSQDGTWERGWRARRGRLDAQRQRAWAQAVLDGRVVPAKQGAMPSAPRQSARAAT
jgi:transposase